MPADIFSRNVNQLQGVFAADNAVMAFGAGVPTTLVQQVSFNYSQAITRLYEVGQPYIYYVGGRTQGQAGVNRVLGPKRILEAFYRTFGNVCNARSNTITINLKTQDCFASSPVEGDFGDEVAGGLQGEDQVYTLALCVLVSVGVSVQANDMIFNEASQLMFSSLEMDAGRALV